MNSLSTQYGANIFLFTSGPFGLKPLSKLRTSNDELPMSSDVKPKHVNHAAATTATAGISLVAFVLVVAVSLAYYQFVYIPQANARPTFPSSILSPTETTNVQIVTDAVLESNKDHFKPVEARAILGLSNKVIWTNNDSVAHTVTADGPQYTDVINGNFDSLAHPDQTAANGYIEPGGGTWSFTFTKVGEFGYHCSPHPWMKGKVDVVENFS